MMENQLQFNCMQLRFGIVQKVKVEGDKKIKLPYAIFKIAFWASLIRVKGQSKKNNL